MKIASNSDDYFDEKKDKMSISDKIGSLQGEN